jgi:hypothetical protein
MRCPNCQHENETGARYCEECGLELIVAQNLPAVPPAPPAASTLPPRPTAPPAPATPVPTTGTVTPYAGPRLVLNSTGSIFKLGDVTVIGREDPALQIDFDGYEDGKYVSHRHAQIRVMTPFT